jgi:hypothetical protein
MAGLRRARLVALVALVLAALVAAPAARAAEWKVQADFPGGAVKVLAVDPAAGVIKFQPPDIPGGGWKVWWFFKVTGIEAGRTIRLEGPGPATPVVSLDGKSWRFMSAKAGQRIDGPEAYFAWYVPFLPADSDALLARAVKACPHAKRFDLCRSEDDIPVAGLRVSEPGVPQAERLGIWVQARQHAWEVGGSWTAAGLAEWLVGDDPKAADLRRRAAVTIIPIMDVDSVVKGRGGKDQKPHDHNRDWSDRPHWRAVAAAQAELKALDAAGRLHVFLDLHDPGYGGGLQIFCNQFSRMTGLRKANTERLINLFLDENKALGDSWPCKGVNEAGYLTGKPAAGLWIRATCREHVVSFTPEIPVGPPPGHSAAKAGAGPGANDAAPPTPHLRLGAALGRALERYCADARQQTDAHDADKGQSRGTATAKD